MEDQQQSEINDAFKGDAPKMGKPEHVPTAETLKRVLHDAMPTVKPLVIEICAGTAMLSRCFQEVGFDIMAVDHTHNRFHPLAHICNLDLSLRSSWEFLEYVVRNFPVCFVHAAPPCGTCSRAREINLGGARQPRPLRSDQYPHGLHDLSTEEQARVDAANSIYQHLSAFLMLCTHMNIPWAVENPARSYLWDTEWMQTLQQFAKFYRFTACAWGSTRPTKKAFLSTLPGMKRLEAECPGDHQHEPYGRKRDEQGRVIYATAEEAAYPRVLCMQIRRIVQESLNLFPEHQQASPQCVSYNAAGSAALSIQPRGRRMPPIIAEFVAFQTVESSEQPPLDAKSCLTKPWHHLPMHAKMLSIENISGDNGGIDSSHSKFRYKFGIFRSPKQWLDDAVHLKHPFDLYHAVPDALLRVVFDVLTLGPVEIALRRAATLKRWVSIAHKLEKEETELKQNMEPGVESILRPKRILLMQTLANELGWPDKHLFDEITNGFKIVGLQEPSGIFDLEPRPPAFSPESLDDAAKFLRPAILGKAKSAAVDDDTQRLWDITCEEASNVHWMKGPIPASEVANGYDKPWIPVRRFRSVAEFRG